MNNLLADVIIFWQTRSEKHQRKAAEWCRNYGLFSLANTCWLGKLRPKEGRALLKNFEKTFVNQTEKYYLLPLCKTCYDGAVLHRTQKGNLLRPPFQIV